MNLVLQYLVPKLKAQQFSKSNSSHTAVMDRDFLIHAFINAIITPLLFISSCLILPPFFFFKSVGMIIRCICNERMKGKVVLITGASSGIGEVFMLLLFYFI